MSGISAKALKTNYSENRLKYNGNELQTKEFNDGSGLEWEDYGGRMYDQQIGRWHVLDPMMEKMRRWSPYSYGANDPVKFIDIEGYIIGNPDDPITKRVQAAFNRTKSGKKLWASLSADKRIIYFDGVSRASEEGWKSALAKHYNRRIQGETMPKEMFEKFKEGDFTPKAIDYTVYNPKTGKNDKTDAWDETHIVIFEDGVKFNADMVATASSAKDDEQIIYEEAQFIKTAAHESQHALQNFFSFFQVTYDPVTGTYKKGEEYQYTDNNGKFIAPHEVNADFKGREVYDEYFKYLKEHPGSAGPADDPKNRKSIFK